MKIVIVLDFVVIAYVIGFGICPLTVSLNVCIID